MNIEPNSTVATSARTRRTVVSAIAVIAAIPIAAGSSAASDETTSPDTTDQATTLTTAPAPSETPASPEVTATAPEPTIGTSIVGDIRLTFTVPDGWENNGWFVLKSDSSPFFGVVLDDRVANTFSDPCQWVELDPPLGPSVDDLVAAFASVPDLNATEPTDVTIDGYHGQQIEFTVPDFTEDECIDGWFAMWQNPGFAGQGPNYVSPANAHHRLWILDVDGTRLVIGGSSFPDTSQQDLDDLDTILNSIQIGPVEAEQPGDTSGAPVGTGSSQRLTQRPAGTTDAPLGYWEYLPPDYDDDGSSPLLVFLHGFGESGDGTADDLGVLLATGIPGLIGTDEWPSERPFVVLAPQHAYPQEEAHYEPCDGVEHGGSCAMRIQHEQRHPETGSICTTPAEVHDFLSYAVASYDVDPDRVYLTGLSCGAHGAWEYVAEYGGDQIAAMVPIAGEGRPAWEAAMCSLGEVAVWAFHGDADDVVAPAGSIETMTNLEECPQPRRDAELTVYPGVDHDSWTATYDLSAGHDIYDWLLGYTVTGPAVAESTGATTSEDTIAETSVSATPDTAAETSVAVTPDTIGETSVPS